MIADLRLMIEIWIGRPGRRSLKSSIFDQQSAIPLLAQLFHFVDFCQAAEVAFLA
jgi:hypothetical protein